MPWYAIVMIAVLALSSGVTLARVNEPREPITPGVALAALVGNGLFIWAITVLASRGGG